MLLSLICPGKISKQCKIFFFDCSVCSEAGTNGRILLTHELLGYMVVFLSFFLDEKEFWKNEKSFDLRTERTIGVFWALIWCTHWTPNDLNGGKNSFGVCFWNRLKFIFLLPQQTVRKHFCRFRISRESLPSLCCSSFKVVVQRKIRYANMKPLIHVILGVRNILAAKKRFEQFAWNKRRRSHRWCVALRTVRTAL